MCVSAESPLLRRSAAARLRLASLLQRRAGLCCRSGTRRSRTCWLVTAASCPSPRVRSRGSSLASVWPRISIPFLDCPDRTPRLYSVPQPHLIQLLLSRRRVQEGAITCPILCLSSVELQLCLFASCPVFCIGLLLVLFFLWLVWATYKTIRTFLLLSFFRSTSRVPDWLENQHNYSIHSTRISTAR